MAGLLRHLKILENTSIACFVLRLIKVSRSSERSLDENGKPCPLYYNFLKQNVRLLKVTYDDIMNWI